MKHFSQLVMYSFSTATNTYLHIPKRHWLEGKKKRKKKKKKEFFEFEAECSLAVSDLHERRVLMSLDNLVSSALNQREFRARNGMNCDAAMGIPK